MIPLYIDSKTDTLRSLDCEYVRHERGQRKVKLDGDFSTDDLQHIINEMKKRQ